MPAISGRVSVIASHLIYDGYFAGIWKKDLVRSLAWTLTGDVLSSNAFNSIPSSSWASFKGLIFFRGIHSEEWRRGKPSSSFSTDKSFEVLEGSTKLYGKDPFGRVLSGKLVVTGLTLLLKGPEWGKKFGPNSTTAVTPTKNTDA